MSAVSSFIGDFLNNIYRPNVEFSDIAEILIIAFFLYHIILWMKTSRAWTLLKGILVIIILHLLRTCVSLQQFYGLPERQSMLH